MNLPLVSICIPTYNGAQYIAEAMESAIKQSYTNVEIIVSDDNSSDNTLNIIDTYKTKTTIPIFIFKHKPEGIGANWNNCIKKANGDYIKFLFQDDVLMPSCVEKMIEAFNNGDHLQLIACKRNFIRSNDYIDNNMKIWIDKFNDLHKDLNLKFTGNIAVITHELFRRDCFLKSPLNKIGEPSTVMFKKNLVNRIGLFREDLIQILDYEFYYRCLKKYNIGILKDTLVKFRLHPGQTTNRNKGSDQMDYEIYNNIIYQKYFWYLNFENKKYFLKKFNPNVFRILLRLNQLRQR